MVDIKTKSPLKTEEKSINPRQEEMFLATVKGKDTVLPEDLYVPPNALAVSYTHLTLPTILLV